MDRLHHSSLAHFRRSMQLDEGTYNSPPIVDFSFFAFNGANMEAAQANAAVSSSDACNPDLAQGRDTAVTQHLNSVEKKNLNSMEKSMKGFQSMGNGLSIQVVC